MNDANPGTVVMRDLARAFLTPRPPRTATGLDFLPGGRRDGPAGQAAAATAGEGPAVLLVHGWEGQARDLGAFASPLIDTGYRVIAVELPAHGQSAGTQTSIPQAADALAAVQRVMGNLHAAIAHSVGAAVLTQAMGAGLKVVVWRSLPRRRNMPTTLERSRPRWGWALQARIR